MLKKLCLFPFLNKKKLKSLKMQKINIKQLLNFKEYKGGTSFKMKGQDMPIYSKESYESVSNKIYKAEIGGYSFVEVEL
jgi:hypothetical protein